MVTVSTLTLWVQNYCPVFFRILSWGEENSTGCPSQSSQDRRNKHGFKGRLVTVSAVLPSKKQTPLVNLKVARCWIRPLKEEGYCFSNCDLGCSRSPWQMSNSSAGVFKPPFNHSSPCWGCRVLLRECCLLHPHSIKQCFFISWQGCNTVWITSAVSTQSMTGREETGGADTISPPVLISLVHSWL